jgi:Ribosomal protein L9, N-terminal domain
MSDLTVVRLLQNPLGKEAPAGHRGDIVRVSDGRASLYLFPWEFEAADEARLRWLLAQEATPANWDDSTEKTEGSPARRP